MITEFFLGIAQSVVNFALGLIPDSMTPPGWLQGGLDALVGFLDAASSMGVWVPMDMAVGAALLIMNVIIGGGVVKAVRIVVSHFTGGGGGAA